MNYSLIPTSVFYWLISGKTDIIKSTKIIIDRRFTAIFFFLFYIQILLEKSQTIFGCLKKNPRIFAKNDNALESQAKFCHDNLKKAILCFFRKSFNGEYSVVDGAPRNPEGRTGIQVYSLLFLLKLYSTYWTIFRLLLLE